MHVLTEYWHTISHALNNQSVYLHLNHVTFPSATQVYDTGSLTYWTHALIFERHRNNVQIAILIVLTFLFREWNDF